MREERSCLPPKSTSNQAVTQFRKDGFALGLLPPALVPMDNRAYSVLDSPTALVALEMPIVGLAVFAAAIAGAAVSVAHHQPPG
jgi:hypothetical protein